MHNITSYHAETCAGPASGLSIKPDHGHAKDERGSALVEFAIVLPLFMLLVTGMAAFGIALNQYLELDNAVEIGAQFLATQRDNATDPCQVTSQAIYNAAPFLQPSNMTITYVLDGTTFGPYTGASANTCSSSTPSTGAAGDLGQGDPAEVTATYPCSLAIYGANLFPGCTLEAEVTEIVQ